MYYVKDSLQQTKNTAKDTGKLLAFSLALHYPFKFNTISFVGFSLGSQVIKECIKHLHILGIKDIIHNVTFMAGAIDITNLPSSKVTRPSMDQILAEEVSGTIRNLYTYKDLILMAFYKLFIGKRLIGRERILHDHERNAFHVHKNRKLVEDNYLYKLINLDLSEFIPLSTWWDQKNKQTHLGHFFYRKRLDWLINKINFEP